MWKLVVILVISTGSLLSCSGKENSAPSLILMEQTFSRLEIDSDIHDAYNPVISMYDPNNVVEIVDRINTSDRKSAVDMVFEKGPEGLLTFSDSVTGSQAVEIPYFPESGDVLYKDYFIDSDLIPLLVKDK